jgi:2-polyprenyl-3-methyl-5-hydroxy-6-metoxy-1,4-benzoquinol methylase
MTDVSRGIGMAADSSLSSHSEEIAAGQRFAFGENWARFLASLNEERILAAEQSLREMLGVQTLEGRSFLDIGSGSGLFSLAARRLGARVHSFDYDPSSVGCTTELRRRFFANDPLWTVETGSALDPAYLRRLGRFDVVYSWGVLHHTGNMYGAFASVTESVASGGKLFIAIYNDQGAISRYWTAVKRIYNRNSFSRALMIAVHAPYLVGARWIARAMSGRRALERGMTLWYDMLDWLGGYPFEVAKPEEVFQYFHQRGLTLQTLRTCRGRSGCNEFVFSAAN